MASTRFLESDDKKYLFYQQVDDNFVVYLKDGMVPLWDRFSYESEHGSGSPSVNPPPVQERPPAPEPAVPDPAAPLPAAGGGRVIRVTDENDGPFYPRMMSYWANAWVRGWTAYVFGGSMQTGGPQFFEVDLASGAVVRRGERVGYRGETEGWHWLPDGTLIVLDGPRLRRVDPFGGRDEIVIDISLTNADWDLWQPHSADDGETYSATVRDTAHPLPSGKYPNIGTVVLHRGQQDFFDAKGVLDESQVSRNGRWLTIKEDRGTGDDNRVIDLETRDTQWIRDQDRALGHSDCGPDYMVGEADKPDPGMAGWWDFNQPLTPGRFHPLFPTLNMGYVSARGRRILHSGETQLRLIDRDTGAVAPLIAHGAGSGYDERVKASLDPSAQVVTYMVKGSIYLYVL